MSRFIKRKTDEDFRMGKRSDRAKQLELSISQIQIFLPLCFLELVISIIPLSARTGAGLGGGTAGGWAEGSWGEGGGAEGGGAGDDGGGAFV